MKTNRRIFIVRSATALSLVAQARLALAMAGPVVDEKDAKAVAVGYRADASKIDKAKFPSFAAGQNCGNCTQFQGKPGISAGPCTHFANKPVLAAGWCSAYSKRG